VKIHGKIYHEFAILREDLDTLIPHQRSCFGGMYIIVH